MSFILHDAKLAALSNNSFWMKECDILRRGAKHTTTHLTYFQGGQNSAFRHDLWPWTQVWSGSGKSIGTWSWDGYCGAERESAHGLNSAGSLRIPDPAPRSCDPATVFWDPAHSLEISAVSLLVVTGHDSYKYAFKTFPISTCCYCRFCAPPLIGGGIKWCFCLTLLSDVCLSRTSGIRRERRRLGRPKLTQR